MNKVFLGLGSNLGNRMLNLRLAIEYLESKYGHVEESSIYETPPWGFESHNSFLNLCVTFYCNEFPDELLTYCQKVEKKMGREKLSKVKPYESRVIDIDILYFGDLVLNTSHLEIPHPRIHDRLFVLVPLEELDHDLIDPITGGTVFELLENCKDNSKIKLFEKRNYQKITEKD